MNNPTNRTAYNLLLKNWFQYEAGFRAISNLFYHGLERGKPVNCFVNLNNYLSPLYKRNDYSVDDLYSIAASIINFCAHIVNFFDTRYDMPAAVYLVYGSVNPYYAITTYNEYNSHIINTISTRPEVTTMINDNLKIIEMMVPYIPNVYFIRDDTCEPIIAMRRIIKYISLKGNKHPRLLFSKEHYDLQLVATTPKTHMVRVKKTMNGDKTLTVSYYNFYQSITRIKNLRNTIGEGISPELYSLYLAYIGCPDKNIKSIINSIQADHYIHSLVLSGQILNGYNAALIASNILATELLEQNAGLENIPVVERFQALDMLFQSMYEDRTTPMCDRAIVDLYDPEGMKFLANKFFIKYPLDLNVF